MKTTVPLMAALVLGALPAATCGQQIEPKDALPAAPEGKTWKLVWHDEFDGTELDTTKWDIPEYLKLSDEIGNWAGDITKAKLPDRFLVEYARVYGLADKE
jgi:hypothetical protein